jgi:hypothetical protein
MKELIKCNIKGKCINAVHSNAGRKMLGKYFIVMRNEKDILSIYCFITRFRLRGNKILSKCEYYPF